jgi:hypothetical protein
MLPRACRCAGPAATLALWSLFAGSPQLLRDLRNRFSTLPDPHGQHVRLVGRCAVRLVQHPLAHCAPCTGILLWHERSI